MTLFHSQYSLEAIDASVVLSFTTSGYLGRCLNLDLLSGNFSNELLDQVKSCANCMFAYQLNLFVKCMLR